MAQWVRVDCDLFDHPKFWLLERTLGDASRATYVLLKMWTWFTRLQPEGELRGTSRCREFAAWLHRQSGVDHDTTPTSLVNALVDAGFLDGTPNDDHDWDRLSVVDWDDYNGDAYDKRRRQKAVSRASSKRHRDKLRDARETSRVTRENVTQRHDASRSEYDSRHASSPSRSTVRHDTLREQETPKARAREVEDDFEFWWVEYGKVGSKADALKLYGWWRERGATRDELFLAAHGYRSHCEATDCKMKHARTFLAKDPNRWKEWAEGEEHGGMDVRGTRRLSDVLEIGNEWLGGDRGQLGGRTDPEIGEAPRRSLPPGSVEGRK